MSKFGFDPIPGMDDDASANELVKPSSLIGLRLINGPMASHAYSSEKPTVVIGRSDPPAVNVDFDLTEAEMQTPPMVSRRHAQLEWDSAAGALCLTDLGSTNGTWIDNIRLMPNVRSARLTVPGRVRLANLEFETFYVE